MEMELNVSESGLNNLSSWCFWLQNPLPDRVAELPVDLVVLDYSADGSDEFAFNALQVTEMAQSGKKIWAYLSIGEAESYRFYWRQEWGSDPPLFLGPENEEWAENYKVRYWLESWWEVALQPYLDRILTAGFDGVYLDIIDAYWFWMEQGEPREVVADGMAELVCRIAEYCRAENGEKFAVCPQNGLGLAAALSAGRRERYLQAISAVGVESLFFNTFSEEDSLYRMGLVREFLNRGIPVLNVEYLAGDQVEAYRQKIVRSGMRVVPFRSEPDRALDRVTPPLR